MTAGSFQMVQAADVKIDIPDMTAGTEFENLGTTVEVIAKGGKMSTAGIDFDLKQFHFHLPSEHLDNGTSHASTFLSLQPQNALPHWRGL